MDFLPEWVLKLIVNFRFQWGFGIFPRHLQGLVFQDFGSKQKFDPLDPKLGDKCPWFLKGPGELPFGGHLSPGDSPSPKLWHKELPGGAFFLVWGGL